MSAHAAHTTLVREARRFLDAVVARELDEQEARSLTAALAAVADRPAADAGAVPWFWGLPPEHRDGSNGWAQFNPVAPPVDLELVGDRLVGAVRFGMAFTGPAGRVHGGYLAAVLDHAVGTYLFHLGRPSVTLSLDVTYPAPSPIDTDLELVAEQSWVEGRRTAVWAELRHAGRTCARAEALLLAVPGSAEADFADRSHAR